MKVVLDTNVLVSALIVKAGKPAQILYRIEKYELVLSEEILAELERVLRYRRIQKRYGITEEHIGAYFAHLRQAGTLVHGQIELAVVEADPDDNKFIECAVLANADYIVSGDEHLLELGRYREIRFISPASFLEILASI